MTSNFNILPVLYSKNEKIEKKSSKKPSNGALSLSFVDGKLHFGILWEDQMVPRTLESDFCIDNSHLIETLKGICTFPNSVAHLFTPNFQFLKKIQACIKNSCPNHFKISINSKQNQIHTHFKRMNFNFFISSKKSTKSGNLDEIERFSLFLDSFYYGIPPIISNDFETYFGFLNEAANDVQTLKNQFILEGTVTAQKISQKIENIIFQKSAIVSKLSIFLKVLFFSVSFIKI